MNCSALLVGLIVMLVSIQPSQQLFRRLRDFYQRQNDASNPSPLHPWFQQFYQHVKENQKLEQEIQEADEAASEYRRNLQFEQERSDLRPSSLPKKNELDQDGSSPKKQRNKGIANSVG